MAMQFAHGKFSEDNRKLQQKLLKQGYDVGPDGADGIFGSDTEVALGRFQVYHGIEPQKPPRVDKATFLILFPTEAREAMEKLDAQNWISKLTGNTLVQYVLVFVGGIVAARLGLDPSVVKNGIPDIVQALGAVASAVVALIAAFNGIKNAATPKAVVNGNVVPLKRMSTSEQQTIAAIVEKRAA